MTASDNVLRLGLTSKTVAIDAALAALSVSGQPRPVEPEQTAGVATYAPQGAPFSVVSVADADSRPRPGQPAPCCACRVKSLPATSCSRPAMRSCWRLQRPTCKVEADGRAVIARAAS